MLGPSSNRPNDPVESGFDAPVLVERCIEQDDWRAVEPYLDAFANLIAEQGPLVHVRLADGPTAQALATGTRFETLVTAGWLSWAEREIAHAWSHVSQDLDEAALALAGHLMKRFGALSPTVEAIARVQLAEGHRRAGRIAELLDTGMDRRRFRELRELTSAWLEAGSVRLLHEPEWIALTVGTSLLPHDLYTQRFESVWCGGLNGRVLDRALDHLDAERDPSQRERWSGLIVMLMTGKIFPELVFLLRNGPDDSALRDVRALRSLTPDAFRSAIAERETMRDFAGAALLRDVFWRLQAHVR